MKLVSLHQPLLILELFPVRSQRSLWNAVTSVTSCQYILLVLFRIYSSVEPKFCDRYSLFVKCIGTLSNKFTRFEQPTAAFV